MGKDLGKIIKTGLVYAIPWFIVAMVVGFVYGMTLGVILNPILIGVPNLPMLVNGLISVAITWIVWLGFDIDKEINKRVKGVG